jgi:Reverse transcriptase (RNA-dependent DNA polymerase)
MTIREKTQRDALKVAPSPTLWNLVIDECLRLQFPENVKISAFADDIKLHCTEKHPLIATIKLQRACESIIEWCKSRMLSLSVEKSEMIIFSRSHTKNLLHQNHFGAISPQLAIAPKWT